MHAPLINPDELLRQHPHEVLIVSGENRLDRIEVLGKVGVSAAELSGIGVKPGERVALFGNNSPELVYLILALILRGAVAMPVDPRLPPRTLQDVLSKTKCAHFIDLTAKLHGSEVNIPVHIWRNRPRSFLKISLLIPG